MSTNPTPGVHDIESAFEQLSQADLFILIKNMARLHPDLEELIKTIQPTAPKQQRIPFNPELYRWQVAEIFSTIDRTRWGLKAEQQGHCWT
jgi:hypothetical protein